MAGQEIEKEHSLRRNVFAGIRLVPALLIIAALGKAGCYFNQQANIQYGNSVGIVQADLENKGLVGKYSLIHWGEVPESERPAGISPQDYIIYSKEKKIVMVEFAWRKTDGKVAHVRLPKKEIKPVEDSNSDPLVVFKLKVEDFVERNNNARLTIYSDSEDYFSADGSQLDIRLPPAEYDRFINAK